jgi:hypothetical protein
MAAFVLLIATAAAAQQPPASSTAGPPDFSRDNLTQIFSDVVESPPKPEPAFKFDLGHVEFRALNMRWRIGFLPFLAPLPGSVRRTVPTMMDAFALTGTELPYTPRTWREGRELSKEMKRIEQTERERAKVIAKTQ